MKARSGEGKIRRLIPLHRIILIRYATNDTM